MTQYELPAMQSHIRFYNNSKELVYECEINNIEIISSVPAFEAFADPSNANYNIYHDLLTKEVAETYMKNLLWRHTGFKGPNPCVVCDPYIAAFAQFMLDDDFFAPLIEETEITFWRTSLMEDKIGTLVIPPRLMIAGWQERMTKSVNHSQLMWGTGWWMDCHDYGIRLYYTKSSINCSDIFVTSIGSVMCRGHGRNIYGYQFTRFGVQPTGMIYSWRVRNDFPLYLPDGIIQRVCVEYLLNIRMALMRSCRAELYIEMAPLIARHILFNRDDYRKLTYRDCDYCRYYSHQGILSPRMLEVIKTVLQGQSDADPIPSR